LARPSRRLIQPPLHEAHTRETATARAGEFHAAPVPSACRNVPSPGRYP
jgi:hypothetical protein